MESSSESSKIEKLEDLLGDISLYIKYYYVTKQLTTEQKELFADSIDAWGKRLNVDDPDLNGNLVDRWWRE